MKNLRKHLGLATLLVAIVGMLMLTSGCSNERAVNQESPVIERAVNPQSIREGAENLIDFQEEYKQLDSDCAELPSDLPSGVTIKEVSGFFETKTDIPFELLVHEVLDTLINSYAPDDYYIDGTGLHWRGSNEPDIPVTSGDCYHPYGFSIVGWTHFVYWFSYRPPSYDAFMAWFPIYAQPYGSNGILVQKRDMCLICGCNPICVLIWTRICAK